MKRGPVITGVIFLLLLVLTWWVIQRSRQPEADSFFALKRSIPDTLTVIYGPDTTVAVPRGETGWEVISPVRYPADGVVYQSITRNLSDLPVEGVYPYTPERADTYGMRFPRAMIRAAYRDPIEPDTLFIGGFTPNGAYDYVRAGHGDEVALLPGRITRGSLLKRTTDLRDTKLIPFNEAGAVSVRLIGPDGTRRVGLERDPEQRWQVTHPYPGPADQEKTREYLRSVNHMHIRDFPPGDGSPRSRYGLEDPVAGIRVTTARGNEFGFDLGGAVGEGEMYAVTIARPEILVVSTKYLPVLQWPGDAFRQKAPLGFGVAVVTAFTVESGGGRVTFSLNEQPGAIAAPEGMREALGRWTGLETERFEEAVDEALRRAGLDTPRGTLTWHAGGDTLAAVDIGRNRDQLTALRVRSGTHARSREILWLPEVAITPLWTYFESRRAAAGAR